MTASASTPPWSWPTLVPSCGLPKIAAVTEDNSALLEQQGETMSSGNSKRYAASRWTAALVVAGVLVQGFGLTVMARAQASGSDKCLEGGRRVHVKVRDCGTGLPWRPAFPAVFTFAKGGAATGITGGQPPS